MKAACVQRLDRVPLDVGAPAAFIGDCFAAVLVALDGFVEIISADQMLFWLTQIDPGFDHLHVRGGLFVLIDDGFAQSMG